MQGNGNHRSPTITDRDRETQSKNLELLTSILQEYSAIELENEIFTLHEVTQVKSTKTKKKSAKDGSSEGK